MHISNPTERKWFRDRIEKSKDTMNFTKNGKFFQFMSFFRKVLIMYLLRKCERIKGGFTKDAGRSSKKFKLN